MFILFIDILGIFITSDLHYDVFIKEIMTNIKRPPGREKMYDLGAKMDVFLRCNAIKMFKGRMLPCNGFETELDDDYLSNIYRQIICRIVPVFFVNNSLVRYIYSTKRVSSLIK